MMPFQLSSMVIGTTSLRVGRYTQGQGSVNACNYIAVRTARQRLSLKSLLRQDHADMCVLLGVEAYRHKTKGNALQNITHTLLTYNGLELDGAVVRAQAAWAEGKPQAALPFYPEELPAVATAILDLASSRLVLVARSQRSSMGGFRSTLS